METYSNKDKICLGRKQGIQILNTIKNAKKSVKIVSPYLSSSYLEELVKLREKGVEITLITSDELVQGNTSYSSFKHSDVIKQNKTTNSGAKNRRKAGIIISVGILLMSIFPLVLKQFYLSLAIAFIGAGVFIYYYSLKMYNYEYYSIFRIKVFDSKSGKSPQSTNLIHSKIFIIDEDIAYLGSANFTYSGFTTHYETVIKIEDKKAIKDISGEVESLFNSTELKAKSIDKWGKAIYESSWF